MSVQLFWAPVFAGVGFLLTALFYWVWGQRRHSLGLRWIGLVNVAFAVCAGLAAVEALANLYTSALWYAMFLVAFFLAVCAGVVALVYLAREGMQRGSGLQRRRS